MESALTSICPPPKGPRVTVDLECIPMSDRTPLVSRKRKQKSATGVLFGEETRRSKSRHPNDSMRRVLGCCQAGQFFRFFLGFMYEEPWVGDDEENRVRHQTEVLWNKLNSSIFATLFLTTTASTAPVALIPSIVRDIQDLDPNTASVAAFASKAAASATLGSAFGKFLNGPVGDICGARRTSSLYAILLSISLVGLSMSWDDASLLWSCFFVEFFQSVQWPCAIVAMATHYNKATNGDLEGGIYIASLALRFGSLLSIPMMTVLLRHNGNWQTVTRVASLFALFGALTCFFFVVDSPSKVDDPQNAIESSVWQNFSSKIRSNPRLWEVCWISIQFLQAVLATNLVPSLKSLVRNGTFWIVAIAHTGDSVVCTSQRVLGTYFLDTSFGTLTENRAGALTAFLSFGLILGLSISGIVFRRQTDRQRKRMVCNLYMVTIVACYVLALLAVPGVRLAVGEPNLVLIFQVVTTFFMGYGIAVQGYIPGLVGASFEKDKGLFAAYVDGIACGIGSIIWRVVGILVRGGGSGAGWASGWAAVALLLVICAFLMVEFMEYHFIRGNRSHEPGSLETIIFV